MLNAQPDPLEPLSEVLDRWDAIAFRWELDAEDRSALLGGFGDGPVGSVATYEASNGERRMRLLVALDPVLVRVLGTDDRIRGWLRSGNRSLGGRKPIVVMASSPAWIRWLIDSMGLTA